MSITKSEQIAREAARIAAERNITDKVELATLAVEMATPVKTLRDEIAIAALTGLLANAQIAKDSVKSQIRAVDNQEWHANTAYQFADAMLKERAGE